MPYGALVERTVPVSRAKLYSLLVDDFGEMKKIMGDAVESCVLEGRGVGAIRRVRARGVPGEMAERLDAAFDGRLMSYSIVGPTSLPLEYYVATVTLADAPDGGCAIQWASNWTAKGAPEDSVRRMLTGLYNGIIDALVKVAQ
ncbi:MAG TPA: SRPBCC family protein [Myxococcota bacterium]|nr:SRPBCC family protein [Myxococcota bacterium]